MRAKTWLLSVFLISGTLAVESQVWAQVSCSSIHLVDEEVTGKYELHVAQGILQNIQKLERQIDWWNRFSGGHIRSTLIGTRHRRQDLTYQLQYGDGVAAASLYRDLFFKFEQAYYDLQDPKLSREKYKEAIRVFGENYAEYVYARSYLEKMMQEGASPEVKQTAQYVLFHIGVSAVAAQIRALGLPSERPSLSDIRQMFHQQPLTLVEKLKRDLKEQRLMAIRNFAMNFLNLEAFQRLISKLPASLRQPTSELIGLSYNSYVLTRYLPDIERVLAEPAGSPEKRWHLLRDVNARSSNDELLVTFARLAQGEDAWREIENFLRGPQASSQIDKSFLARMETAAKKASKLGDLPRFEEPGYGERLVSAILPVSALGYGFYQYGGEISKAMEGLNLLMQHLLK